MQKQNYALKYLMVIFWVASIIQLLSESDLLDRNGLAFAGIVLILIGIFSTQISFVSRIPLELRASCVVVMIILFEFVVAYFGGSVVTIPMMISVLAIAVTPFRSKHILAITGIAGNALIVAFGIFFPRVVFNQISIKQLLCLILFMDCVIIFARVIISWTNKQVQAVADSAFDANEASVAKGEFLAAASHEIRTPMNAIFGMTEIILAAPPNACVDELKEKARLIKTSSFTLLELINSILDISKLEQGKMQLIETDYNAKALFKNLENSVRKQLLGSDVLFCCDFDFSIAECLFGDDVRIKQICSILLSNAIKYTSKGHIDFTVKQVQAGQSIDLVIKVEDTGIGIKPSEINELFCDYKAIYANKNVDGMGFGLAIAARLLELMNGVIDVSSVHGEGSVFTVTIPQKLSEQVIKAVYDAKYENVQELGATAILVVDDNATNLQIAKGIFKKYNAEIDTASSGEEALKKAQQRQYDIIFMDYIMPNQNGIEAARSIRESSAANSAVAIVALTADNDRENERLFLKNGLDAYLTKPIEPSSLELIFQKFLPRENTVEVGRNVR